MALLFVEHVVGNWELGARRGHGPGRMLKWRSILWSLMSSSFQSWGLYPGLWLRPQVPSKLWCEDLMIWPHVCSSFEAKASAILVKVQFCDTQPIPSDPKSIPWCHTGAIADLAQQPEDTHLRWLENKRQQLRIQAKLQSHTSNCCPSFCSLMILHYIWDQWEEEKDFEQETKVTHDRTVGCFNVWGI